MGGRRGLRERGHHRVTTRSMDTGSQRVSGRARRVEGHLCVREQLDDGARSFQDHRVPWERPHSRPQASENVSFVQRASLPPRAGHQEVLVAARNHPRFRRNTHGVLPASQGTHHGRTTREGRSQRQQGAFHRRRRLGELGRLQAPSRRS